MKGYEITSPGIDVPAYLQQVNQGVGQFADGVKNLVADQHEYAQTAMDSYTDILMAGGKRLRGVLTVCGYEMYGGEDKDMIAQAAGVVEGFHASLLVADDTADNATTRRGVPAAHCTIDAFLQREGVSGDTKKMAADMAITAALAAQSHGQVSLMELDVPPDRKVAMASNVNGHLARTGVGQLVDLASTVTPVTETDIMSIARLKTALYTFQMPLEMGAQLAGATAEEYGRFAEYALSSGIAFQLHDDIIGTFGDESVIGKSIKSDTVEGKQTLLVAQALKVADERQRAIIEGAFGNKDLTDDAFAAYKQVIVETGALDAVRKQAQDHANRAQEALAEARDSWPSGHANFLGYVASYATRRSA